MENYKTILLTRKEIDAALLSAKKKKFENLGVDRVSRRELLERLFWERIKTINPNFVLTIDNEKIINGLLKYFSNDPTIESEGIYLKKGIMLAGPVGCGKTSIMKAFSYYSGNNFFGLKDCREIALEFMYTEDADYLSTYKRLGKRDAGFCFDDLGTEETVVNYGNRIEVISDIVLYRYNRLPHNKTHFTTNLSAASIGDIYGDRMRSRLKEMVNFISFDPKAKDMRS